MVGHDFDYRAPFALRTCPLPGLQPAFQVDMPAFIQVFAADLSQQAEANNT
jgi:hypothetical protein